MLEEIQQWTANCRYGEKILIRNQHLYKFGLITTKKIEILCPKCNPFVTKLTWNKTSERKEL